MIIYQCINFESNTLIFSKDIEHKPFLLRTDRIDWTDPRMGTYVAMHYVAKIIKWLLILSAYYCPSLCVYELFSHIRYGLSVHSYHSLMWLAI